MVDSNNDSGGESTPTGGGQELLSAREHERFLPIANVSRIMKKALPANAKISKDAKETVQECVSEFISFVTGEAADRCLREKRKTINGDDLLWAMTTLGFEEYLEPLKIYLQRYRDLEGEKTTVGKERVERDQGAGFSGAGGGRGVSSGGVYGNRMVMVGQVYRGSGAYSQIGGEDSRGILAQGQHAAAHGPGAT